MFGIGFPELMVILVVCLLVFGPGKLPEMGEALGKAIRDFQRALRSPPEIEITPTQPSVENSAKLGKDHKGGPG
jgi:sec-independent protein translocase protein TatA